MSTEIRVEEGVNGPTDPLGGRFDIAIPNMRVAQGHGSVAVAEQPGHDRNRYPLQDRLARECMAAVVQTHALKPVALAYERPETEFARSGSRGIARRGKDVGTDAAGLPQQDALGFGAEEHRPGAGLAGT